MANFYQNKLDKSDLVFESRGVTPSPDENTLVLMVTGHRPNVLDNAYALTHPTAIRIGTELKNKIKELGGYNPQNNTFNYRRIHLISGMALGVDTYFYAVGIALRAEFPNVFTLEAAVPHQHHGSAWIRSSQDLLLDFVDLADVVTLVTDADYQPSLMSIRNEYMVDMASECIAVWNGNPGGTGNCVNYINRVGKSVHHLDPTSLTWTTHRRP